MKSVVARLVIAVITLAALGAGPAAGADKPLPLKEGRYVLKDVPCDRGISADTLHYYLGDNNNYCIGVPHGEWEITKVRNKGNVYYVTVRSIYKGVEGILAEHKTILVKSSTSFSVYNYPSAPKGKKKPRIFRWCND
jgi:hypothetical protein